MREQLTPTVQHSERENAPCAGVRQDKGAEYHARTGTPQPAPRKNIMRPQE